MMAWVYLQHLTVLGGSLDLTIATLLFSISDSQLCSFSADSLSFTGSSSAHIFLTFLHFSFFSMQNGDIKSTPGFDLRIK